MQMHPEGTSARFFQENPLAAIDLLEALKEVIVHIQNPIHPARLQAQAAIDLAEIRHIPRRASADTWHKRNDAAALRLQQQQSNALGVS